MRTLWLQIGGTEDARTRLQLPRLNYPLCFNVPRSSWVSGTDSVHLFEQTVNPAVFLDLLVEVRDTLSNVDPARARLALDGFRWCAGISDRFFIQKVSSPSTRDEGVCFYYSRFPDGYNVISHVVAERWDQISEEKVILDQGGADSVLGVQFDHRPEDILSFLSGFTTLNPGDLISVGSIWCMEEMDQTFFRLGVTLGTEKWGVEIHRRANP